MFPSFSCCECHIFWTSTEALALWGSSICHFAGRLGHQGALPPGSGGVFSFSLLPQNDKHEGCGPPPPPHLAHSGHAHAGVALSQPPGAFVPCRVQQCLACTPFLGPRIRNGRGAHQRTSVLPSRLVGWELEITQKKARYGTRFSRGLQLFLSHCF